MHVALICQSRVKKYYLVGREKVRLIETPPEDDTGRTRYVIAVAGTKIVATLAVCQFTPGAPEAGLQVDPLDSVICGGFAISSE